MRIAFYGSSLVSSYWNGAATYYRGILRDLAARGYRTTFLEPDAFGRQQHRDIDPPPWCAVQVWPATEAGLRQALGVAATADIVVKASGVGVFDEALLAGMLRLARPDALRIFWDVDAPATLAEMRAAPDHPLRAALPRIDCVLTYGGGPPVVEAYRELGARRCVRVQCARSRHAPPRAGRSAIRGGPVLPGQPAAGSRGAGGGLLPACGGACAGHALPAGWQWLGGEGDAAECPCDRPCADGGAQCLQRLGARCAERGARQHGADRLLPASASSSRRCRSVCTEPDRARDVPEARGECVRAMPMSPRILPR